MVSVNLDPASDPGADRTTTFSTVHFAGTTTPNASVAFLDQSGGTTTTATTDSTGCVQHHGTARERVQYLHGDDPGRVSASRSAARSRRSCTHRRKLEARLLSVLPGKPNQAVRHAAGRWDMHASPTGLFSFCAPCPSFAARAARNRTLDERLGVVAMTFQSRSRDGSGSDLTECPRRRGAHDGVFLQVIEPRPRAEPTASATRRPPSTRAALRTSPDRFARRKRRPLEHGSPFFGLARQPLDQVGVGPLEACIELAVVPWRRFAVPGTDILADVAAEDPAVELGGIRVDDSIPRCSMVQ